VTPSHKGEEGRVGGVPLTLCAPEQKIHHGDTEDTETTEDGKLRADARRQGISVLSVSPW
jgi:hypothetical protein